jgi:6-pyruvoyltetrahydropterin/6-carboxytetrahydropterin synthase
MYTLNRQVRFSITPFSPQQPAGFNSYASNPTGTGLSIYLALWVELEGHLDPETGFIVNVSLIDGVVRESFAPGFSRSVTDSFEARKALSVPEISHLLASYVPALCRIFKEKHQKTLKSLRLELNPNRWISLDCRAGHNLQVFSDKALNGDTDMLAYTEKFEFAAMHKLWNDNFSPEQNFEAFGKCANPAGHGHNYILEVTVRVPVSPTLEPEKASDNAENAGFSIPEFQKAVKKGFVDLVDHKNLNVDVPGFEILNPTVENLASFAWRQLKSTVKNLSRITVWENDRTYCTYCEDV